MAKSKQIVENRVVNKGFQVTLPMRTILLAIADTDLCSVVVEVAAFVATARLILQGTRANDAASSRCNDILLGNAGRDTLRGRRMT